MKIIKISKVSKAKVYNKNEGQNIDTDKSNYTVRSMINDLFKWEKFLKNLMN
jgi:hypothetical protein